jgi:hypothetical protein
LIIQHRSSTISSPSIPMACCIEVIIKGMFAPVVTPVTCSRHLRSRVLPDRGKVLNAIFCPSGIFYPSSNLNYPSNIHAFFVSRDSSLLFKIASKSVKLTVLVSGLAMKRLFRSRVYFSQFLRIDSDMFEYPSRFLRVHLYNFSSSV